jgi:hypothetical protein
VNQKTCNCLLAARIRRLVYRFLIPVTIRITGSLEGVTERNEHQENVHRKVLMNRKYCQQTTTKNEPVAGRNILQRA